MFGNINWSSMHCYSQNRPRHVKKFWARVKIMSRWISKKSLHGVSTNGIIHRSSVYEFSQTQPAYIENIFNNCEINVQVNFHKSRSWTFDVWFTTLKIYVLPFSNFTRKHRNVLSTCKFYAGGSGKEKGFSGVLMYRIICWSSMYDYSQNQLVCIKNN